MPGGSQGGKCPAHLYRDGPSRKMPWKKTSRDNQDIIHAKEVLEEDHYGLEQVKDRVLEFLAVRALTKERHKPDPLPCGDHREQVRPPLRDPWPARSERSM